jgi:hypothetical protein
LLHSFIGDHAREPATSPNGSMMNAQQVQLTALAEEGSADAAMDLVAMWVGGSFMHAIDCDVLATFPGNGMIYRFLRHHGGEFIAPLSTIASKRRIEHNDLRAVYLHILSDRDPTDALQLVRDHVAGINFEDRGPLCAVLYDCHHPAALELLKFLAASPDIAEANQYRGVLVLTSDPDAIDFVLDRRFFKELDLTYAFDPRVRPRIVAALTKFMRYDQDGSTRAAAVDQALRMVNFYLDLSTARSVHPELFASILDSGRDPDPAVRSVLAGAVVYQQDSELLGMVAPFAADGDANVRASVLNVLWHRIEHDDVLPRQLRDVVIDLMDDEDESIRLPAITAACKAQVKDTALVTALQQALILERGCMCDVHELLVKTLHDLGADVPMNNQ